MAYWGGLKQRIAITAVSWDAYVHWVCKMQLFSSSHISAGLRQENVFGDKGNVVKIFEEST
jgi:hypothetical protein